jgi:integrase
LKPENGLHGRQRDADTARKIVEVAQLAWKWADESERWPDLVPRPRTIEMVRAQPGPVTAPCWDEMDAVVNACEGWIRCLAVVLRYTGLRVTETMMLLWSDINLEAKRLTIRPELDKSKRGRVVPLSPHLIEEMQGWGRREGFVVPENGDGDRARQAVAKYMAHRWRKAGVAPDAWSGHPHHAFRRRFKTGMLALGVHPDAVDYLQGHRLGGARARYIDPWQALHLEEAVAKIPRIGGENVVPLASRR